MAPSIDIRDLSAALPPSPQKSAKAAASSSKAAKGDDAKLKAANLIEEYQDFFYADRHSKAEDTYAHKDLLPTYPNDPQPPLDGNTVCDDRGAYSKARGGWEKGPLNKRAHIEECIPTIGSEITGIDLRSLSNAEKDDLALLVAERGVVIVRDQHEMTMHDQLDLGRYFGPLHKHATTGVPADPAFKEVHVVYTDSAKRPPSSAFSKLDLWHSDVTYELQPPGITSLRILDGPKSGGDTLFASNYALYDSLSPGLQKYLEGLYVVHSAYEQAEGNKRAGQFVRREPIESIHPLVRVHPVTGWRSIFLNRGFARYIVGIPKAESEMLIDFLSNYSVQSEENKIRARWRPGTVVFWDNRIVNHSGSFDFYPSRRHAVRVTVTGERPTSVDEALEAGWEVKSREAEMWDRMGFTPDKVGDSGGAKGYAD